MCTLLTEFDECMIKRQNILWWHFEGTHAHIHPLPCINEGYKGDEPRTLQFSYTTQPKHDHTLKLRDHLETETENNAFSIMC